MAVKIKPVRLMIVRGLPGSGKSTWARSRRGYVHYENDMFWVGADGVYRFVGERVREAFEWCQDSVSTALAEGRSVVVSNTFTTHREILPYIELAEDYRAAVEVVHVTGEFGSVHGVPDDVLAKMAARWQVWEGERVVRPRLRRAIN